VLYPIVSSKYVQLVRRL